jgi:hypothetical protein
MNRRGKFRWKRFWKQQARRYVHVRDGQRFGVPGTTIELRLHPSKAPTVFLFVTAAGLKEMSSMWRDKLKALQLAKKRLSG